MVAIDSTDYDSGFIYISYILTAHVSNTSCLTTRILKFWFAVPSETIHLLGNDDVLHLFKVLDGLEKFREVALHIQMHTCHGQQHASREQHVKLSLPFRSHRNQQLVPYAHQWMGPCRNQYAG